MLADFEKVGVETVMKIMPPQPKYVSYMAKNEGQLDRMEERGGKLLPVWKAPIQVSQSVPYPYTGYGKLCEEQG